MAPPAPPAPPTPATGTSAADHQVVISLDAADLDASTAFYLDVLGFRPLDPALGGIERPGLIFETRTLVSPDHPALRLRLRAAFGRRPIGSSGGLLSLALRFSPAALASAIARLKARPGVRWIGPPPSTEATTASLADPDGYIIELFA